MAIELKSIVSWKKAIDSVSSFISEGNFHFSDNGIFFRAIDQSQVVFVNFEFPKKLFEKYSIEPSLVGVDIVELSRIMNRAMPDDKLIMNVSESELLIDFEGELSRKFSLPLIDINEEEVNIPETNFDSKVEISARILKETLKDASLFGSSVVFRLKNNVFMVESQGSSGTLKTQLKQAKVSSNKNSDVTSKFSLNFLQNIVREADSEKKILLELKNDAPMKISYSLGTSDINFRLAHMIL